MSEALILASTNPQYDDRLSIDLQSQHMKIASLEPKINQEGWTDAHSAVGFCLGSGLFGSYNSD